MALQVGDATVFTHNKVKKRLERGPEHNIWNYYQGVLASLPQS